MLSTSFEKKKEKVGVKPGYSLLFLSTLIHRHFPFHPAFHLPMLPPRLEQARTSTLNSLHLRLAVQSPPEPLRELVAIPNLSLLRLHASELASRAAADGTVRLRRARRSGAAAAAAAHHGAMLAGLLAILGERLGERLGGRGGVDLGCVVDFLRESVSG